MAWKLSEKMDLDLVMETIDNLEKYFSENNLDLSRLLLHSDCGFQYTSPIYYHRLKKLKITQSMSRKGNSIDNAPVESFFGHTKDEIGNCNDLNFKQLHRLIDEYMLGYNHKRKQ